MLINSIQSNAPCTPIILNQDSNSLQIGSNSDGNHFLVFADTFLPGWRAWVDGKETTIYKTNGTLKGVYLPKDAQTIVFRYSAPGFYPGLAISLISLLIVALNLGFKFNKTIRKK